MEIQKEIYVRHKAGEKPKDIAKECNVTEKFVGKAIKSCLEREYQMSDEKRAKKCLDTVIASLKFAQKELIDTDLENTIEIIEKLKKYERKVKPL